MSGNTKPGQNGSADPDDAPELTAAFFHRAEVREGERIIRRGRPPLDEKKQVVTIRFPPATLAKLRSRGRGWQRFVVEAVERALG